MLNQIKNFRRVRGQCQHTGKFRGAQRITTKDNS